MMIGGSWKVVQME